MNRSMNMRPIGLKELFYLGVVSMEPLSIVHGGGSIGRDRILVEMSFFNEVLDDIKLFISGGLMERSPSMIVRGCEYCLALGFGQES